MTSSNQNDNINDDANETFLLDGTFQETTIRLMETSCSAKTMEVVGRKEDIIYKNDIHLLQLLIKDNNNNFINSLHTLVK